MWFTLKSIVAQIATITNISFCHERNIVPFMYMHDISGDKHLPLCDASLCNVIYEL